ncbi:Oidioi.mRNA.OKI2018_I69.XSR.g16906.t1.cds [Oikopleura dioica]|uniref:Oidioi.mRNA.OKI2018_I69.XSR.g16906.t1.cds n=1 Tax=Oikopleura dioica TaxID=34765 RepID=A0ABN7SJD7_OIKDI|nr:Oidioi.mRNA.OKI2018_I69.XSR.g16906.t1.cds [Oikopleura dioica]
MTVHCAGPREFWQLATNPANELLGNRKSKRLWEVFWRTEDRHPRVTCRAQKSFKMLFRDPEGELLHSPNGPAVRDDDQTDKRAFLFFKSKSMIILPEKIQEEPGQPEKHIRIKEKEDAGVHVSVAINGIVATFDLKAAQFVRQLQRLVADFARRKNIWHDGEVELFCGEKSFSRARK